MSPTPMRVLILGHSFVRRANHGHCSNFNLVPSGHLVNVFGRGGLTFDSLLPLLSCACAPGYHLEILYFRTNDLVKGCPIELLVDRALR